MTLVTDELPGSYLMVVVVWDDDSDRHLLLTRLLNYEIFGSYVKVVVVWNDDDECHLFSTKGGQYVWNDTRWC